MERHSFDKIPSLSFHFRPNILLPARRFDVVSHVDNGFQTSCKRVEFADKNWRSFKTNNFLKDFTFYWFREDKNLNRTREELEKLTQELRKFYKPTCNGLLH